MNKPANQLLLRVIEVAVARGQINILNTMAKDQELLQAVKSSDLNAFRKIAAKVKAAKSSEYFSNTNMF